MSHNVFPHHCPDEPFRGLEPYRLADAPIFFERDQEIRRLLQLTTIYRGSLLYGESGSGKSSLINAGLIPSLLQDKSKIERIRVQPRLGAEFVIERIESGFGDSLPSTLIGDEQRTVLSAPALLSKLGNLQAATPTVLVFDQFEEMHTLAFDQKEDVHSLEAQDVILQTAETLIKDAGISVRALFVFREDYLAKFERLFYLCPDLPDRFLRLTAPTPGSLEKILRGPFTTPSLPQPCWSHEITADLAAALEQQLQPRGGRVTINLAQTQIAALQLWRSKGDEKLLISRGVEGLVEDYLEQKIGSFGRERNTAESLLSFLITREGTRKIVLEEDALEQLKKEEKKSRTVGRKTLDRLVETRLVRRDYNRNAISYEIVSEFLVRWIRALKLERESRRARSIWMKRALALAIILALAFVWRYRTTSIEAQKERIVQKSLAQAQAAEKARDDAQARLQQTLALIGASGDERAKALSAQVLDLTKLSESQRNDLQSANRLLLENKKELEQADARATNAEKKVSDLMAEIARLKAENEELNRQIANSHSAEPPVTEAKKTEAKPSPTSDREINPTITNNELATHPGRVTVAVHDDFNRMVIGLDKETFTIVEDHVNQPIKTFYTGDAPSSIAVVLDAGGGMKPYWQQVRSGVAEFVKTANPQSEITIVQCQDQADRITPFTSYDGELENAIGTIMPRGRSAILDGIYLALNEMKSAKYERKVIVVLSGNIDTSHHKGREILELVYRSDVQIYFVPIRHLDITSGKPDLVIPEQMIQTLALASGGGTREMGKDDTKAESMPDVLTKIGIDIRNTYVFVYTPTNLKHDGKLRHIEINLAPPKGLPHLNVSYRRAYYAPSE